MAFFRNRAVNLLNLHYGIHSIALSGGAAFFLIYLLNSGVPILGVLVSLALILMARFAIRPIVVGCAARWGLRVMLVAGTLLSALQYPLLAEVDGTGFALAALIAVAAVGDTVYWTTYHAYFAALGDDRLRGQQIGVREAIATVVGIASPLLTGWMLVTFGPRVAFGTTSVIVALAALPILWAPEVKVAAHVPGVFRTALPGILLFAADGWIAAGYVFVWQIALFGFARQELSRLWRGARRCRARRRYRRSDTRTAHRRRPREAGGLVRFRHIRADRRVPGRRDRQRHACHPGECFGGVGRVPLRTPLYDGGIHPGEAFCLHASLPRRDRGWLGCRRCRRCSRHRAGK
jgi:hypothetical protein